MAFRSPSLDLALPERRPRAVVVGRVAGAFAFRWACFAAMTWLALWAEARPAPHLPDALLSSIPYVPAVDRLNYVLWVVAYVPMALWLLGRDVDRFCRYMYTAGFVALLRGVCIVATGLGPVRGPDVNAGIDLATRFHAWTEILSPFGVFARDSAHLYLTKDLFFSGHTSTTFLLLLYVWRWPTARWVMLALHLGIVAVVFLSHLHYTVDVIGAWAITFTVFVLREGKVRALLSGS